MICFAFAIVVNPFIPFIELNGDCFFMDCFVFNSSVMPEV
jgi:hypothetical protein